MHYPTHPTVENLLIYYKEKFAYWISEAGKTKPAKTEHFQGKVFEVSPAYTLPTREWWDKFIDDCITQDLKEVKRANERIKQKLRESDAAEYRFVTIGYPHENTPEQFIAKWRAVEASKWKWGDDRITRFEFYRNDGKYHPHVHMFIYTDKKKSQIVKELKSKTKLPDNFIDVKTGRLQTHMNYIKGIKQDSKQADMERDAEVREKLGMEEYEYSEKLNLEKI